MLINRIELLFTLLISSFFIQLTIFNDEVTSSSLNLYHLLIPFIFLLTFRINLTKIRLNLVLFFFLSSMLFSLIAYARYGFSLRFVQLIFCVIASYLGFIFIKRVRPERRDAIYCFVVYLVLMFVVLRDIYFINKFFEIYSRSRNVEGVIFLSSGGRNLEATLLGLLPILCLHKKKLSKVAFIFAFISSMLMMSRAGMITAVLSFLLIKKFNDGVKINSLLVLIFTIIVAIFLGTIFFDDIISSKVIARFDINNDIALASENEGRIALWKAAFVAIYSNYFGYGVGNGVSYSMLFGDIFIRENNLHNIYIQYFAEIGFTPLIIFIAMLLKATKLHFIYPSKEGAIFIIYGVLGIVEFTGYEPYIWFFIGAFWCRYMEFSENE